MLVVNSKNGERASYNDESIIIEAFKEKDLVNNKIQYGNADYISKKYTNFINGKQINSKK